ncbi:hypothetical protein AVEN_255213-1 [Araneus ventricosus]|uniref:RNA-directed DNA polymerase n=1 Tax=Araneus ventricosus TaxID=182803 RepID=A0A4Y2BCI9_ARAVE|nr:hypothetical protein AVEN_255213-1 [Araneus ventricosus]
MLDYIVGGGVRTPAEAKIKVVLDFPTPSTKTHIGAFLGFAGYYAHYVKNFSLNAAPLTHVLKGKIKKVKVIWTKDCYQAFKELKSRLTAMPVLYAPDYKKEFIIQTDVSDDGMGIIMSQRDEKNEHPILYLSQKFSDAQNENMAQPKKNAQRSSKPLKS